MEVATDTAPTEQASIAPKGWTNPPKLSDLKQNQADAKSAHDVQKAKIRIWLDNLQVTGSAKFNPPKGFSSVQPKLIRKQAEWRYASLSEPFLSTPELFTVNPVTWEDKEPARQNALLLNHQFNTKMDKQAFIDEYVRANVDEGTTIVKLNWMFEEKTVEEQQPIYEYSPAPQMAELFQELAAMRSRNPTGYKSDVPEELKAALDYSESVDAPYQATIVEYETVEVTKTVRNAPAPEICDYRHVMPDPSCRGDLDKAGFVIHSFTTSLSDLEKAGKYKNLGQINTTSTSPLADPDHETDGKDADSFQFKDKPRAKLIAYEYWGYWDYDGSGIAKPIVSTWVNDTLIRLEESPAPDGKLPFVFVPNLPVRGSLYGEPDGELLIDNQKIIGAITRGMVDVIGRSANGQMGTRKGTLDAVNLRRFQLGKDYEFNGGVDPRMAFYMHTFSEIPASAQYMLAQQNQDAEAMSGVKAYAGGINGDSLGSLATSVRGALDSAGQREMGILRRLASGITKMGRKIISMNAEFLEDEEIVRITNEEFIAIRRDDLGGEFDLVLAISTSDEDNIKAQELAFMLQTMGNNADPGMVKIILRDIARLRKMHELAKQIEEFEPKPDPIQQAIAQLEVEKLQAEIAEIHSRTAENFSDAELNAAKARHEAQRSRLASSTADKTDLDFIEQESGVKQERDKEVMAAQAEGNIKLARVKAALAAESPKETKLQQYLRGAA
jgi:hypothetical protein